MRTLEVAEIGLDDYKKLGLASSKKALIKMLGSGELTSAMTIHAHKFSKSAVEKIEKAGGKAVVWRERLRQRKLRVSRGHRAWLRLPGYRNQDLGQLKPIATVRPDSCLQLGSVTSFDWRQRLKRISRHA